MTTRSISILELHGPNHPWPYESRNLLANLRTYELHAPDGVCAGGSHPYPSASPKSRGDVVPDLVFQSTLAIRSRASHALSRNRQVRAVGKTVLNAEERITEWAILVITGVPQEWETSAVRRFRTRAVSGVRCSIFRLDRCSHARRDATRVRRDERTRLRRAAVNRNSSRRG